MAIFEEPTADPRETLIGEGKKYATDDDALKALVHAQAHIARLEDEAAQRRIDEANRQTFEQLLEQRTPPAAPVAPPAAQAPVDTQTLAEMIRNLSAEESERQRVQSNISQVSETLVKTYGSEDKANEVVAAKAKELGVSLAFMQEVAAKSPKAFFTQIGITAQPTNTPAPTGAEVRIPSSSMPAETTYTYFKNLRKTAPNVYNTPETRNRMAQLASAYGAGWTET